MAGPASRAGSLCFNCATPLVGRFCHACGQERGPTGRSLRAVAADLAEALTHGDSRLRRTLRLLATRPGRLTRDWLDGRRASDIPPVRVFFWSLLILFLAGSLTGAVALGHLGGTHAADARIAALRIRNHSLLERWLRIHLGHAVDDLAGVVREMGAWAERAALLMLPVAALTSKLLFVGRRPAIALFDHVVLTMHSLAFAMLLFATTMVADRLWSGADLLLLLLPIHLFVHLRGAFGGGRAATALRVVLLLSGEAFGFTAIVILLALIGLEWG